MFKPPLYFKHHEITVVDFFGNRLKLVYTRERCQKHYKGIGKSFPDTTMCDFYLNDKHLFQEEVVKHYLDENDLDFACLKVSKKVLNNYPDLAGRKLLWNRILKKFKPKLFEKCH